MIVAGFRTVMASLSSNMNPDLQKVWRCMRTILFSVLLLAFRVLSLPVAAQSVPAKFPLAGDWKGDLELHGTVYHLVLHMNTTPEGKLTALLDYIDQHIEGLPATGGSFDGSHLVLRFFYWKPNAKGDTLDEEFAPYEATVNASGDEMTGVWKQDGSWPLNFKRLTWEARNPKPAPPTIFDGDWAGIEYERKDQLLHFTLHITNTEDGLVVWTDCQEEQFKGLRTSKVTFNQETRQIAFANGQTTWTGKLSADGNTLETSLDEPGFHFLIQFDRLPAGKTLSH